MSRHQVRRGDLYEVLATRPDPETPKPSPDETITLTRERVDHAQQSGLLRAFGIPLA